MTPGLARIVVLLSAWLAPRAIRRRWREEWLAELEASAPSEARRALGAPWDAVSARWTARAPIAPHRRWSAGFGSDVRQSLRALRRSPAYVVLVMGCLSVGMAASLAVFSLVNALFNGDQAGIVNRHGLVRVFLGYDTAKRTERISGGQIATADPLSRTDFNLLADHGPALEAFAVEGTLDMATMVATSASGVLGAFVSGDYFRVLGTPPQIGRLLVPDDVRAGAPPVVVVSDYFWRSQLNARPDVVGVPIQVSGHTVTVVGVGPARFSGITPLDIGASASTGVQVWLPLPLVEAWPGSPGDQEAWLTGIGRLAPGATRRDAEAQLNVAAARIEQAFPATRQHARVVTRPHGFGTEDAPVGLLAVLGLLLAVPLSVLAIGCANVANLQLVRATERTRELAVRLSLGATRANLLRLLLFDGIVLAVGASALATAGALALLRLWQPNFPAAIPFDRRVTTFLLVVAFGVTIATGLAPAWLVLRRTVASGLMHGPRIGGGLAHARLRHALVIMQVALSVTLLFIGALFERSLSALNGGIPSIARQILVTELELTKAVGYTPSEARRFVDAATTSIAQRRSIEAVGFADFRPSAGDVDFTRPEAPTIKESAGGGFVSAGWFGVFRSRLLAGRLLTTADAGAPVAVVNESLAQRLQAPGRPVVGSNLIIGQPAPDTKRAQTRLTQIVGVIADALPSVDRRPVPAIYQPLPALPPASLVILTRSAAPDDAAEELRQVIASIDPRLPWMRSATVASRIATEIDPIRYAALSVGTLGTVALGLSLAGLYAVLAYVVSLRRREIGVRMALGARPRDVVHLVVRQSVRLVAIGGAVGFGLAVPLAFIIRAALIGVSPVDPLAVGPTLVALATVAMVAAVVPARRAARVDPATTLRDY